MTFKSKLKDLSVLAPTNEKCDLVRIFYEFSHLKFEKGSSPNFASNIKRI